MRAAPERRLRHQRERQLTRQSHAHAGVGQRLHDQELIARTRCR